MQCTHLIQVEGKICGSHHVTCLRQEALSKSRNHMTLATINDACTTSTKARVLMVWLKLAWIKRPRLHTDGIPCGAMPIWFASSVATTSQGACMKWRPLG